MTKLPKPQKDVFADHAVLIFPFQILYVIAISLIISALNAVYSIAMITKETQQKHKIIDLNQLSGHN